MWDSQATRSKQAAEDAVLQELMLYLGRLLATVLHSSSNSGGGSVANGRCLVPGIPFDSVHVHIGQPLCTVTIPAEVRNSLRIESGVLEAILEPWY